MERATIRFTSEVAGTTYREPSWWGLDGDGYAIAGPRYSRREVQAELAAINRLVRTGVYAPRPLYTGY